MAYAEAENGNVAAMRVMIEVERSRMELDGLKRPAVLHVEGSVEVGQPQGPLLRDVLPPEVVADVRSVRAQALALHRALPVPASGAEADDRTSSDRQPSNSVPTSGAVRRAEVLRGRTGVLYTRST